MLHSLNIISQIKITVTLRLLGSLVLLVYPGSVAASNQGFTKPATAQTQTALSQLSNSAQKSIFQQIGRPVSAAPAGWGHKLASAEPQASLPNGVRG